MCSNHVHGYYGKEAIIDCCFQSDYGVYLYVETDEETFTRLENGVKSGRGYDSHEYDVLQNGSLVIKNVHEQEYKVISLDSELRNQIFRVTFSVVENSCPSQVSGLHGEEGTISCYFRPNFQTIIWFDETSTRDPLIRLEHSTKSGRGYDSGKYDVLQNGSLVINTIEFINEQQYTTVAVIFGSMNITEFSIVFFVIVFTENQCASLQHGYLGKEGIISCNIDPDIDKVYWFIGTDDHPFIRMESGDVIGSGYKSNEYDILQNGSLVIRNVQYKHQQSYKVTFQIEYEVNLRVEFSVIGPTTSNSGSTLPSEVTSIYNLPK
ncbi:hypothetical protein BSL78_28451 [Apostichopus japonicus]|uniref:Immunoglobulin domain-containing protein n=1 Tax=Stichopus japonicus TaxID=307972 RepID=A0A2G8JG40_STIJA|nr:hypothetical protein BSL78_28451 [Apostichopus japonicus]